MTDRHTGLPGLHLALEADGGGAHPAAPTALTPRAVRESAVSAERAGFTLVTFADAPLPPGTGPGTVGRIEAGTRAAYVSGLTDRIGLAPTLHVTTTEPFHLATQLAALDHASHGRAAWLVGAAAGPDDLATVGRNPLPADALHQEVTDVVDTARALWDSWEDDAIIKDVPNGRFLDPDRVHHIDFEGASFTVKGPLITPRSPQGQIVVLAPDSLEIDDRADVVLVARSTIADLASRATAARESGAPLVFAEVEVVLDTAVPAADRLAELNATADWPRTGRLRHIGSPESLTGLLTELARSVDGIRLHPAVLADDLPVLAARVLPALAATGLHHPPRPGDTLRTTLGLPRPAGRFAAATTNA
ncbi:MULTISPECIES: LLM class flavin-dependent oxidoreductase [unclassified Streptomyces]|uniref:LLM class flavin-dependent oxidoreductase n=1 Tax=unclassified Streptomyces TaxID=2593676 RepID=UPI002254AA3B|nr:MULTISPECIES: LLM class flavin-dependent oxidoreductase [unclassified Streptomyces]MCX5335678.1 LLM class flavin-dependent oxidoreductase [Streptomyces sp. NBC_00140]MCX5366393.1 LLM class flavin-dependent oxidoreductase [Streptomyces sp. NBC_00124]